MTLLIIILRAALGLAIVGVAIMGLVLSFMTEGVGCVGSAVLFIFFVAVMIAENVVGDEQLEAFMGMDPWDYSCVVLICCVGGLLIPETHITGIATSLAVGYTGLIITGFLGADGLAALYDAVMGAGIIVLLPIVLPMVIVIVVMGLAFKG